MSTYSLVKVDLTEFLSSTGRIGQSVSYESFPEINREQAAMSRDGSLPWVEALALNSSSGSGLPGNIPQSADSRLHPMYLRE